MKNLITLIFLISFTAFGQYQFNVSVELGDANKGTVTLLEDRIQTTNRNIDGNIISFMTTTNYSESYIDSLFVAIGVEPFLVVKEKLPVDQHFEKAGGNNCELAELLCSGASVTGTSTGPGTVQELNGTNQGCLGVEHQSSWYYINIQTAGTLSLTINPNNNTNDYDFAIWGPFNATTANANCPPVTQPVRCSFAEVFGNGNTGLINNPTPCDAYEITWCGTCNPNSECAYGDQFVNQLTTAAGQIYIMMIDNWSASNQGYALSFGGTSTLGCTPVILPIELVSFTGAKGNYLTWNVEAEINCDFYTLERSINGYEWEVIGDVQAVDAGSYTFTDHNYRDVINYYRLSQTDLDGSVRVYDNYLVSIDNRTKALGIVSITNLLGQNIDDSYKGLIIIIYVDGTTIKTIRE